MLRSLAMALLIATAFVACSKDNDDTPAPFTIEGDWSGKIGTGIVTPSGQYAIRIKPGGVIERVNGSGTVTASGTWELIGDGFIATYNYENGTVVNVSGTVDKILERITATWENNGGEEGTLYADKQ